MDCLVKSATRYAVGCRRHTATSLRFQNLGNEDIKAVSELLTRYTLARTCDFSVGGIFMWADWFGYERCLSANSMYLRGHAEGMEDVVAFSLPVCADVTGAVRTLLAYCRRHGQRPVFSAVPECWVDEVVNAAARQARVTELTDWADYLYDLDDLAGLRGKRFNKKRNHVNRFIADNPHYEIEEVCDEIMPEVILFVAGRRQELVEGGSDPMALYEFSECMRVISEWKDFGMDGVVLRDETGSICAFAAAEVIGDTAFVHIEKCDHTVSGANEAIASMFAKWLGDKYPCLRYLNREEDVGDEGLRAAKESWHPVEKLKKFNILF